jgi:FAD/FMN-containing dehydrogenase
VFSRDDGPAGIEGRVLWPGDLEYYESRTVWNARFESHPDLIVRVAGPGDVATALEYARTRGLVVGVKSGGHDYAGNSACDGGLLIDLGDLGSIDVDPAGRRAVVGAGVTWGEFDAAVSPHGLATTAGTVSTVGVAGFTLGGGEGWLTRKHGLACDNLVSAEVVTAAGSLVRASATENDDLFWALRGGSGNFGIVTSFELALHPLDHPVLAGQVIYPIDRAAEMLRLYRDVFRDAPDETACFPFFYRVPPIDPFPAEWHGQVVVAFVLAYLGPVADGEQHLAVFREMGDPILDGVFPQPWVELQQSFDAGMAKGFRWYSRAHYFDELSDEAIDTLIEALGPFPGDFTSVYFGPGGGAAGRIGPGTTAYPHRGAAHGLHIFPGWVDPELDDDMMAWARGVSDEVAPYANGGVYVNLLGEDERERIPAAYGANYERLRGVKQRWDPENIFHRNHNIPPRA